MEVMLVVREKLVRDQIKVGLQQFPEFTVTAGEGYAAINEARQHHYDCIFLSVDPQSREGLRLLQHLRSFDRTTEVVVVTTDRHARDMAQEKGKLNVSFLTTPINVTEFFRLVARFRARKLEQEPARK